MSCPCQDVCPSCAETAEDEYAGYYDNSLLGKCARIAQALS